MTLNCLQLDDSTESNQSWRKLRLLLKQFESLVNGETYGTQLYPHKIKAFSQLDTKSQFMTLPLEFQSKLVSAFEFYVDTLEAMVREGESPKNSKKFLWRAMKTLGLVPLDDLFEQIGDDEIVEVYSSEGIQVFRSFSFLEPLSYTIEDLIVFPWHDLFVRDEQVTEKLIAQAIRLFNRDIDRTQVNEIDFDHLVTEAKSPEQKIMNSRFGIVSPIKSREPSQITYFATTFKIFELHEDGVGTDCAELPND